MARVKTFVNGGQVVPNDLNLIEDDYETNFSAWHPLVARWGYYATPTAGSVVTLGLMQGNGAAPLVPNALTHGMYVFTVPPAISDAAAAGGRSLTFRMAVTMWQNAVAQPGGQTVTVAVRPTTVNASGLVTEGTPVANASLAFTGVTANSAPRQVTSTPFSLTGGAQPYIITATIASFAPSAGNDTGLAAFVDWRYS